MLLWGATPASYHVREGGLEPPCPKGHTALNHAEAAHGRTASSSRKRLKRSGWPIQPGLTSITYRGCPRGSRTSPATFVSISCPRTRRHAARAGCGRGPDAEHDRTARCGWLDRGTLRPEQARRPPPRNLSSWLGHQGSSRVQARPPRSGPSPLSPGETSSFVVLAPARIADVVASSVPHGRVQPLGDTTTRSTPESAFTNVVPCVNRR